MKSRLGNICQVQMGYPFRSKLERSDANNCITVIQMKDIDEKGCLSMHDLVCVEIKKIKDRYKLRKGDVIFKSRGHLNNAAQVVDGIDNTVAASPLMVLKLTGEKVLPAYVAWYINQPNAQKQIESVASGTSVRMISKADLEELEVPIPLLDIQKKIIEIAELWQCEQTLNQMIEEKRGKLVNSFLNRLANKQMLGEKL